MVWGTQQASSIYLKHGTSLLSTTLPLWICIITLGSKNDDEELCLSNNLALMWEIPEKVWSEILILLITLIKPQNV